MSNMICNNKDCISPCSHAKEHETNQHCGIDSCGYHTCVPASLPVSGELRDMIAELIHAEYEPEIVALIKSKGLVMLAEDQTLPPNPYNANNGENSYRCGLGYNHGQSDMFHAGWRKIQEEK